MVEHYAETVVVVALEKFKAIMTNTETKLKCSVVFIKLLQVYILQIKNNNCI